MDATASSTLGGAFRRFVGAPVRPQTYRSLAYLALAFPLGICYFVGLLVGICLGVGLLVVWIGLPILLGVLTGASLIAGVEAALARRLVGVDASPPAVLRDATVDNPVTPPGEGFVDTLRQLLTAPPTWMSILLVVTKFAFGIAAFVALVTVATVSLTMVLAPLLYDLESLRIGLVGEASVGQYQVGPLLVDTLPEAVAVSFAGVVALVAGLNLLDILARIHATYTALLLNVGETQ